jgi:selenocysteine lyase/cysteine desulfurase
MLKRNVRVRFIGFSDTGSSSQASEDSYAIRVSTGYFNNREQVETFKSVLQEVLSRIS